MFLALVLAVAAVGLGVGAIAVVGVYSQQPALGGSETGGPQSPPNRGGAAPAADGRDSGAGSEKEIREGSGAPIGPIWQ